MRLNAFKFVFFFYRQNSSHSPEKFMFNGLNQLYTGCASVRSRGKALMKDVFANINN